MAPISGLLCLVAGAGIYAALPRPSLPSGAIKPEPSPPTVVTDIGGFLLCVPLFSIVVLGMANANGPMGWFFLLLLVPACASLMIFLIAIRQETSWVRFFGNGFEFALLGLKTRVRYVDLADVKVKHWVAKGGFGRFLGLLGLAQRSNVALLGPANQTKTLVFTRKDGSQFTISSELIPDLQRILVGMDRAGVELPKGISERQRKKIRKMRERMYGADEEDTPQIEQQQVARIAALIEHARRH
ncbi:hypothetical protein E1178_04620 [Roseibium hamelinense]|nr:hypothetical protein [Roseibium hamelinense]